MASVIVAQGSFGRTIISCDDGRTWIQNRSFDLEGSDMVCGDDTPVICEHTACKKRADDGTCYVQDPCDCGHEQGSPKGIVVAQGAILANFGWGAPGVNLHSIDGVHWDEVFYHEVNYAGLAYGMNKYIMFSIDTLLSDDGIEWTAGPNTYEIPSTGWLSPREFSFLDFAGGGRFIGAIDGDWVRVSADAGQSWQVAIVPAGCMNGIGNSRILTGNEVAVFINADGRACQSSDGGMTWNIYDINGINLYTGGGGVFANGLFMVWGNGPNDLGTRYSSPDGITWTATPLSSQVFLGAVGVSPEGTLVATGWFWSAYEGQTFHRSTDNGLTWTEADDYVQGHMIFDFASGKIPANTLCPGAS
jgi:hypothetical protein